MTDSNLLVAAAASKPNLQSIIHVVLANMINPLIPILIAFAIILFAWGVFNYTKSGMGDKAQIEGAKSLMFWGVVVFFVMVSVWGLVAIIQKIFLGDIPSAPINASSINKYGVGS